MIGDAEWRKQKEEEIVARERQAYLDAGGDEAGWANEEAARRAAGNRNKAGGVFASVQDEMRDKALASGMTEDEYNNKVNEAWAKGGKDPFELINDYMNQGQNKFQADPYSVNQDSYNYGGYGGGAQDWSDQALAQGQRSQQYEDQYAMQGADAISSGRQSMYASEDPLLSGKEEQSRYYQGDSLGLAQQAAYGNAPSVAQNQLTYGIGRTIADQSSAASSARGAAAMAMAQQSAMGNSAQALGDYNNQMAMLRAQEMATARAAYQQGTEQMRGQDQSRLTQSNQVSQFNAGQGQNEAQLGLGLAQLGLGYGNQAQGYNAQAQNIQGQQLQAQGNQQAQNSQNQQAANGINSGISGANAAAKAGQTNKVIGAGLTAVATIAGGPAAGAAANAATKGGGSGQQSGGGGIGGTNPNTGTNDPYYGKAGY
jgi:hypothetical protein